MEPISVADNSGTGQSYNLWIIQLVRDILRIKEGETRNEYIFIAIHIHVHTCADS